jgi:hypothetical protein
MRLLLRVLPTLLVLVLALALAGCGGGDGGSGSGGDLASKQPKEILGDVSAALGKVRSYHVEGTQTDKDGRSTINGDVSAGGDVKFRMTLGGNEIELVAVGDRTYMKADRGFWSSRGGAAGPRIANLLADRWVVAPDEAGATMRNGFDQLLPKNLAYCVTRTAGTVGKRGTEQLDGRDVVVLTDKGDKPGTSPGELYVSTSGPALPLRVVQTGPEKPGGTKDPRCGDQESTTTASDIRLSDFDKPLDIKAPPNPLDLTTLSGAGSSSVS